MNDVVDHAYGVEHSFNLDNKLLGVALSLIYSQQHYCASGLRNHLPILISHCYTIFVHVRFPSYCWIPTEMLINHCLIGIQCISDLPATLVPELFWNTNFNSLSAALLFTTKSSRLAFYYLLRNIKAETFSPAISYDMTV